MDAETAANILGCDEEEEDFQLRLQILTRMHFEVDFQEEVKKHFNPPYAPS